MELRVRGNKIQERLQSDRETILCFSHLRWNFVYQRPQHLLTRAASHARVFFIEEPVFAAIDIAHLRSERQRSGVEVVTPVLPHGCSETKIMQLQKILLDRLITEQGISNFIAWYYTPMALLFTSHLRPQVTVYDCMDQLSAFQGAPPAMVEQEKLLFKKADVVFMGGRSLYESKRKQHSNVHAFPSSVDFEHFARSRKPSTEPADQVAIPHPRVGFFGVLDERLDRDLLREAAVLKPGYHFVLIGPVVKISHEDLPQAANIHYLGSKQYSELPEYMAHWDVAMLPFALNESTRYISPTKTPEYLSAGKRVVSTPIRDVVEPYGRLGFARIAASAEEFCTAIAVDKEEDHAAWLVKVDAYLAQTSWDKTFEGMWNEVARVQDANEAEADGTFAAEPVGA